MEKTVPLRGGILKVNQKYVSALMSEIIFSAPCTRDCNDLLPLQNLQNKFRKQLSISYRWRFFLGKKKVSFAISLTSNSVILRTRDNAVQLLTKQVLDDGFHYNSALKKKSFKNTFPFNYLMILIELRNSLCRQQP